MRPIRATQPEDALVDLKPKQAPPGFPQAAIDHSFCYGGPTLPWYRGHQAGIYDAYLTIKKEHPRVAEKLRVAFNMDENGSFVLR